MTKLSPIRILLVEDFHAETEAIELEFRDAELLHEIAIVKNEKDYRSQLISFAPDIILSPYSLRGTNAIKLLAIARNLDIDVPFILLAFDLSEDIAIDLLAEGIEDYIQQSTLKRLPVAVRKALQRHKIQIELLLSEHRLKTSEAALINMVRNAPIAVAMFDCNMNYLVVSDKWLKHEKKTEEELIGNCHYDVVPEVSESWKVVHQKCLTGATLGSERENIRRTDGSIEVLRWKMNPWYDSNARVGGVVLFIEDISNSVETQIQLEKTAESLAVAQQIAKIGSWALDINTKTVQWSDEMFAIHGIKKQLLDLELIRDLTHPEDVNLFDESLETLVSGTDTNIVYRVIQPKTKQVRYLRGLGRVIQHSDGSIIDLSGTVQDITEPYQTNLDLNRSEASLRAAQQIAKIGSWEWTKGDKYVSVSDEIYAIYETKKKQFTLDDIQSFVHPDDKERVANLAANNHSDSITLVINYRIITAKGNEKFVISSAKQVLDADGNILRLAGTLQDVSERISIEQELREKKSFLTEMAENINEVFYISDLINNKVLYASPLYESIYGQPLSELYEDRKAWEKVIHPDDLARVKKTFNENAPLGTFDEEFRLVMKDGTVKWVRDRAFPISDENGVIVRLTGITEDITEHRFSQERIKTLSLVASETINGVLIHNPDGKVAWANKGFTTITGYSEDEIIGKEPWAIVGGAQTNASLIEETYRTVRAGKSFSSDNQLIHKDGRVRWVNTTFTPILDSNGTLVKVVSIGTDISKQKELEELQRTLLVKMEEQVKERTSDLEEKNLELRKEIWENQRISDELYHNNLDLKDSIEYAKRIQESILPSGSLLRKSFADSFILFLPRDIVSGDFYWYYKQDNLSYFASIDCTGHGVPGALMSMIANELMNQAVIQKKLSDPAEIVTALNKLMIRTLRQRNEANMKDGMDLSLIVIDHSKNALNFCGALSSMYVYRNNELECYPGNRHSVGGHLEEVKKEFTATTISLSKGDTIYLSTDGYIDQFGGPQGKKLMKKRFAALLKTAQSLPMEEQKTKLFQKFEDWKGPLNQVDDVLLVGLRY